MQICVCFAQGDSCKLAKFYYLCQIYEIIFTMICHQHIYRVTSSQFQTLSMSTEEGWNWEVYIPPHTNIRTMDCKIAGAQHIQSHWRTFDHLIICAIVSYLTSLTFFVQKLHIYTRYIAKINAFSSRNIALDRVNVARIFFFSYEIISATVHDPNLNFSIARILCRFCQCANYENTFYHMFSISNKLLCTHQARASKFSGHDKVTMIIICSVIMAMIGN